MSTQGWTPQKLNRLNRLILTACYPDLFHEPSEVRRLAVIWYDQACRVACLILAILVFVAMTFLGDANLTSIQSFYRDRLRLGYLADRENGEKEPVDSPLAELDPTSVGAPYPLISATETAVVRQSDKGESRRRHFLFSPAYCGIHGDAYERTEKFQERASDGKITLADAMAVSGAAVSPIAVLSTPLFWLMFLMNLRLGKWFPRPRSAEVKPGRITAFKIFRDFFSGNDWRCCFLTDGGQYENLGIEPLLLRRCRLIIASDSGQDQDFFFEDLSRLVTRLRVEHGIRLLSLTGEGPLPLDDLKPDTTTRFSRENHLLARIEYPPKKGAPSDGVLLYLKSTITGRDDAELEIYRRSHPKFPHDSTTELFYTDAQVEAYRHLGELIAGEAIKSLPETGITPGGPGLSLRFDPPKSPPGPHDSLMFKRQPGPRGLRTGRPQTLNSMIL